MQKQESCLFQFLNDLDDSYASQRSQIFLMHLLSTVEMTCFVIQPEESQRGTLKIKDMNWLLYIEKLVLMPIKMEVRMLYVQNVEGNDIMEMFVGL